MSYRKVGGLHFVTIGDFGASFYLKRNREPRRTIGAVAVMGAFAFAMLGVSVLAKALAL